MSSTTNRLAITAMATAGLIWPVFELSATAAAGPALSPGVPCLDMVQQFAAAPPSVPESLETAVPLAGGVPPLPVPRDLVCEGTAWSAERSAGGDAAPPATLKADRRDDW